MLNSKIRPRAVVGYGVKIFHPSPPNYVTRSLVQTFLDYFNLFGSQNVHLMNDLEKNCVLLFSTFGHVIHIGAKQVIFNVVNWTATVAKMKIVRARRQDYYFSSLNIE